MAQEEEAVDQPQGSIRSSDIFNCRCIIRSIRQRCRSDRFPRTVAVVCGILLPLFGLIALTIIFGYWISRIESPPEIVDNNQRLAATAVQMFRSRVLANLTAMVPRICLQRQLLHYSFLQENHTNNATTVSSSEDFLMLPLQEAATAAANQSASETEMMEALINANLELQSLTLEAEDKNWMDPQELLLVNATELYENMIACLDRMREALETLSQWSAAFDYDNDTADASGELTFNWNRCTPYEARSSGHTERNQTYAYSLQPVSIMCAKQSSIARKCSLDWHSLNSSEQFNLFLF